MANGWARLAEEWEEGEKEGWKRSVARSGQRDEQKKSYRGSVARNERESKWNEREERVLGGKAEE